MKRQVIALLMLLAAVFIATSPQQTLGMLHGLLDVTIFSLEGDEILLQQVHQLFDFHGYQFENDTWTARDRKYSIEYNILSKYTIFRNVGDTKRPLFVTFWGGRFYKGLPIGYEAFFDTERDWIGEFSKEIALQVHYSFICNDQPSGGYLVLDSMKITEPEIVERFKWIPYRENCTVYVSYFDGENDRKIYNNTE
jgi:hypothetical protein